jgi:hypothetical protein
MALLRTIGKRALNERFLIDECLSGALVAVAKAQGYQRVARMERSAIRDCGHGEGPALHPGYAAVFVAADISTSSLRAKRSNP